MRILVCGGRTFGYTPESYYGDKDFATFNKAMDLVLRNKPTAIIQGNTKGGDEVGALVAESLCFKEGDNHLIFPVDWKKHGNSAVHIRDQQMLDEGKPDLVIAFAGGKGTANMIQRSKKAGVRVIEVQDD